MIDRNEVNNSNEENPNLQKLALQKSLLKNINEVRSVGLSKLIRYLNQNLDQCDDILII